MIYAQSGVLLLQPCDDICMPHVSDSPQCHAWQIDHLLLWLHGLSTNMSTDTLQGVSTDPEKLGPKAAVVNGKNVLQLLNHCNGSFRPGILTALVGSSGAGKTTLMDVLAGRKTSKPSCAFPYLKLCLSCTRLCLSLHRAVPFPTSDCAFPYVRLCLSCIRLCLSCIKSCLQALGCKTQSLSLQLIQFASQQNRAVLTVVSCVHVCVDKVRLHQVQGPSL